MKLRLSALALGTTLLVGCASSGTDQQGRSDPLEGFNRTMYNFNFNVLDPYIVRPVAVAWRDYVPQPARNGLSNFTGNLEEPAVMVNYFLQGDPYQGMVHFTRFFLNTILGMGGFIDVAGMANPKLQRTEPHRFGSTLGHYGPPAIIYRKHRDCGTTRHAKTDNEQRRLTYAIMGRRAAG